MVTLRNYSKSLKDSLQYFIRNSIQKNIHNTLEAATYAIPVLFGPKHDIFQEAVDLISCGGAWPVENIEDSTSTVETLLLDKSKYQASAEAAGEYVKRNAGATRMVIDKAKEYLTAD